MDAARLAVQALITGGVRQVVLAPGSRSAPMSYALAEAEAVGLLRLQVRIDERVAGFTALGLALGSGGPAAVLTTSGTAVGNLLPAVMEANHAAVPLLVLSADRPEELRGTGANQTTVQLDIFGDHVRFATDVAAGTDPTTAIGTALSAAQGRLPGTPAGPVQLNLAFRDPLTPALNGSGWELPVYEDSVESNTADADTREANTAETDTAGAAQSAERVATAPQTVEPAPVRTGNSRRSVVVAGHGAGASAEIFARSLGLPLLAEPSSNARYGPNAIGPYRLLLEYFGAGSPQPIERVVVFGRPTLSRPVAALLARADLERALYLPRKVAWFEPGRRPELVLTDWDELIAFAGHGPADWLESWQIAALGAEAALDEVLTQPGPLTGLHLARAVWAQTRGNLMLGSSNPVRDVDLAGRPKPHPVPGRDTVRVFANRGLAGIDGTVSTGGGIALADGASTRVLLGDLTLLHDAGGLLLGTGEPEPDLQLVVLNDSGGGIFTTLEHGILAGRPRYAAVVERLFGTPHSVDLAALAAGYGVVHRSVGTTAELTAALAEPFRGRSVLEVPAGREGLRALHERVRQAVDQRVTRVLP
ncbi:2-succinyl-5-enolpyruvyl-6-hydroxy-3-cyclohexene-1-carboxylic-acid synthase [Paenarthrobacter sp. PH39-S1]|uniref:2-succinyl-5-enolpyruvyl-6-hydroxy-3- cyclohexene-1-carboxylic-acid synthase n=1 Tax=Paenarthrobacter sp. PH39-S1 TaxID=3046204 RepID=UPI0024BB1BB9|nr:2-succinyl-5-enolpyruvyl-6-hydroxy-3-cyclohexene-1-carboxylic-acid synthase [Paenarthrobacter sp. PH39-S1]MDJ0355083.1 2-succinyl-5-enolpyruvyl-6-hydroxy-3-cyclohexene-1-carboxylic-acid synthase [Paenarthrobacter sp. PH39-S1]